MTPEGKGERVIAKGFLVEGPTWTPNGRMIAYTKKDYPKNKKEGKTKKIVTFSEINCDTIKFLITKLIRGFK